MTFYDSIQFDFNSDSDEICSLSEVTNRKLKSRSLRLNKKLHKSILESYGTLGDLGPQSKINKRSKFYCWGKFGTRRFKRDLCYYMEFGNGKHKKQCLGGYNRVIKG